MRIYIYGNIFDLASPFYFRMMKKLRRLLMRRNTKVSQIQRAIFPADVISVSLTKDHFYRSPEDHQTKNKKMRR